MAGLALVLVPAAAADVADEQALAERFAPVVRLVEQEAECGLGEPHDQLDVELLLDDEPTVALRGAMEPDRSRRAGTRAGAEGASRRDRARDLTRVESANDRLPPRQPGRTTGARRTIPGGHARAGDVVAVPLHRIEPETVWSRRPGHIREWERMLVDEGTALVKVFLNVSKDEQRERTQERNDDPNKRWKFWEDDLEVRRRFDEYLAAREDVIGETSTEWAPWHVVPADRNWVKSTAVAALPVDALERLDPKLPDADPDIEGITVT